VAAVCFPGSGTETRAATKAIFDWHLDRRAAFEMNVLSNRYGLNQFDLLVGMVPWLIACQRAGLISELNGQPMVWRSPAFWSDFLHAVAYRHGLGDALAEGGWAAARKLDLGLDLARRRYAGWGHAGHWDGREGYEYPFPFWLVSALQWLSDSRDPFSTGHGSLWPAYAAARAAGLETDSQRSAAFGHIRAISERVYGSPEAADPFSGYEGRAHMGLFHTVRPVIKDCLPVDDLVFPLIYAQNEPDRYWRLRDIHGVGDIEGPSVEYHLFRAGTGVDWPEEEFQRAAERICTLERALHVRHWGRDRHTDEMVLPYFEEAELYPNPLVGKRLGLDRQQFKPVMDQFYRLHGWDAETAMPTPERLCQLDLDDVYQPMIEGTGGKTDATPTTL
jgi:aldehyde:ferredoxin oxidoreductase